jgi:hypothetical protein
MQSGIKQGCPISGLLFNIAIDPIVRSIQGRDTKHRVLAYADDLVLLADRPEEMQNRLDAVDRLAESINISINPKKSFSMHLSGATPIGTRDTRFRVKNQEIRNLRDGELDKFLGKPVGFQLASDIRELARLMDVTNKILTSKLAPWQRLDALKTFFYPSLNFLMRTGRLQKGEWGMLDNYIRASIKNTLNVRQEAANDYIYGPTKSGCAGIPEAASVSDHYLIDNAFKLLTSKDPATRELALGDLQSTVQKRLGRQADQHDLENYLTGYNEGEFRRNTNAVASTWTNARKASMRREVQWSFENLKPTISFNGKTLDGKRRRSVLSSLKKAVRARHLTRLWELPSQGKVMEIVAADPASAHFFQTGLFTRFADWRFIHRARLNLLPLNGNNHSIGDGSCRRCGYPNETLPHVINHCMRYAELITRRHNAVVDRVRKAASYKFTILAENEAVCGNLRPDLVIANNTTATIIDITIPFENRLAALEEARREKRNKYVQLARALRSRFPEVKVDAIVLGTLRTWDPENDKLMKTMCSRQYLKLFKKLCVSDVIRYSCDIYIEHITGIRQQ